MNNVVAVQTAIFTAPAMLGSTLYFKVGGTWKQATLYRKGGTWKMRWQNSKRSAHGNKIRGKIMKGITFGTYHSYDDFNLLLTSKEVAAPKVKTIEIDVPGADGALDLTEFSENRSMRTSRTNSSFQR